MTLELNIVYVSPTKNGHRTGATLNGEPFGRESAGDAMEAIQHTIDEAGRKGPLRRVTVLDTHHALEVRLRRSNTFRVTTHSPEEVRRRLQRARE